MGGVNLRLLDGPPNSTSGMIVRRRVGRLEFEQSFVFVFGLVGFSMGIGLSWVDSAGSDTVDVWVV